MTAPYSTEAVFVCPECGGDVFVPGRRDGHAVQVSGFAIRFAALEHALGDPTGHTALFEVLNREG